jgi:hypothetical protein
MDLTLFLLFGAAGALSTFVLTVVFTWGYNKENKEK